MYSVCPSVCKWNTIDNFVSILNILFNSFVISTANYGLWSNTMLSGNLYNSYMLSLNNLTNSSTNISSIVTTKCVILDNILQTTRIAFFLATNGNFGMKSTIRYVYSFSRTSLSFNFPVRASILFFIFWHISHSSIYLFISLITTGY